MSVDYGTDVQALDDLPEVEVLVDGDANVAQAIAHRWMTQADAHEEIGDTATYDSFDIRDWLGRRFNLNDRRVLDDLQTQAAQVALGDPRVQNIVVGATVAQGKLTLTGVGIGDKGPFKLVLSVDLVTAELLRTGG